MKNSDLLAVFLSFADIIVLVRLINEFASYNLKKEEKY
jgi:hypothetical protein